MEVKLKKYEDDTNAGLTVAWSNQLQLMRNGDYFTTRMSRNCSSCLMLGVKIETGLSMQIQNEMRDTHNDVDSRSNYINE